MAIDLAPAIRKVPQQQQEPVAQPRNLRQREPDRQRCAALDDRRRNLRPEQAETVTPELGVPGGFPAPGNEGQRLRDRTTARVGELRRAESSAEARIDTQ